MSRKRKIIGDTPELFIEPSGQLRLTEKSAEQRAIESNRVDCLGMTFNNDDVRRGYFLGKLREKLKDPEFRKIEGFPIGSDEDILALSDPPYYTACPNPFVGDFIRHYGKPYDPSILYSREPFAVDVSEGKTGALYNAHSYHTKVPPRAIETYVLHFTEPGDVVLDGFCGTGMTGVATIGTNADRSCFLVDLSPAASFISALYASSVDAQELQRYAESVLHRIESEVPPIYATVHPKTKKTGSIESVIWSTVMICPSCSEQVPFWNLKEKTDGIQCPKCLAISSRTRYDYSVESYVDPVSRQLRKRNKKVPVEITFKIGKNRFKKLPDENDIVSLNNSNIVENAPWFPTSPMLGIGASWGDTYRAGYHRGYENAHDFYFPRTLLVLSKLRSEALSAPRHLRTHLLGLLTSVAFAATHLYKYRTAGGGQPAGNNLYIPALIKEQNIFSAIRRKLSDLLSAEEEKKAWKRSSYVSTGSATDLRGVPCNSVDYIFVDPPFGANIMYSESSFLWEAWLKIRTSQSAEAIINKTQKKGLPEYQTLMTGCFKEFYRVLKPGRWMTVEFHNSQNTVWTSIQEALGNAGFVVADVRTLDKKQGTFKQVTTVGAVKQDLIISAYKPNGGLEERFKLEAGTEEGVWDFIRTHLKKISVFIQKDGKAEIIAERQNYLLFDRMVAFHVQRNETVPLSASEFYIGLIQRFPERDGMFFLSDQVDEYDKKRLTVKEIMQLNLFVLDEATSIQWLRQQLAQKPQTLQELHPQFIQRMKDSGGWQKHEKSLELSDLLNQNFLRYDGVGDVPSQIHSYLSTNFKDLRKLTKDALELRAKAKDRWYVPDPAKAGDLEKLRERALLRDFDEYRESKQKKLKVFRLEAVRAGFKKAWVERDYATIVNVAEKIPDNIRDEDPQLVMWYGNAVTRTGGA